MSAKVRLLVHRAIQQLQPFSRATHHGQHVSQVTSTQSTKNAPEVEQNTSSYLSNTFLQSEVFQRMAKSREVGRPYTVVVEGNIGSGKVCYITWLKFALAKPTLIGVGTLCFNIYYSCGA